MNEFLVSVANKILKNADTGGRMAVVNPSKHKVETLAGKDQWHTQNNKITCEYCQGTTPDDTRGNCVACGAPRQQPAKTTYHSTGSSVFGYLSRWE